MSEAAMFANAMKEMIQTTVDNFVVDKLENFIVSKNPLTVADVDAAIKEWATQKC